MISSLGPIPFCPTHITDPLLVGQGTDHPIGYTEEEIAFIYWKVKQFSVNSTTTLLATNVNPADGSPNDPSSQNGTFTDSGTIASSASNYNDLVCGASFGSDAGVTISLNSTFLYQGLYYPYITAYTKAYTSIKTDIEGAIQAINNIYARFGARPISYQETGGGGQCSINLGTGSRPLIMYLTNLYLSIDGEEEIAWIWDQYPYDGFFGYFPGAFQWLYTFDAEASSEISVSPSKYW
jgi:hypothetical protein